MTLMNQVDQIIKDAKALKCGKEQAPMVLKRVSHLLHLFPHVVPTLHAERMKNDLKFVGKSFCSRHVCLCNVLQNGTYLVN